MPVLAVGTVLLLDRVALKQSVLLAVVLRVVHANVQTAEREQALSSPEAKREIDSFFKHIVLAAVDREGLGHRPGSQRLGIAAVCPGRQRFSVEAGNKVAFRLGLADVFRLGLADAFRLAL